jgi:hypothetical protein
MRIRHAPHSDCFSRWMSRDPAASVCVTTAIDAAAAMEMCVENWSRLRHVVKVNPQDDSVSFQQAYCCVIFSTRGRAPVKVVQAYALPPSFVSVEFARQVPIPLPLSTPSPAPLCAAHANVTLPSVHCISALTIFQRFVCALLHCSRSFAITRCGSSSSLPTLHCTSAVSLHPCAQPLLRNPQLHRLLCLSSHSRFLSAALLGSAPLSRVFTPVAALLWRLHCSDAADVLMRGFMQYMCRDELCHESKRQRRDSAEGATDGALVREGRLAGEVHQV